MSGESAARTLAGLEASAERLGAIRRRAHPGCVVCSPSNPMGLGQDFLVLPDGSVEGRFLAREVFEGYSGLLHGGVTAALLDGAMTNCLFARGVEAMTAELSVRYRGPVMARGEIEVRAWVTGARGRLRLLRADLRQCGRVKATAQGKFLESHE